MLDGLNLYTSDAAEELVSYLQNSPGNISFGAADNAQGFSCGILVSPEFIQIQIEKSLSINSSTGVDGQVLTSHGVNDPPTWETPAGTTPAWSEAAPGVVERSDSDESALIPELLEADNTDPSGLSNSRTPSEQGLFWMLKSFLLRAWIWAAKQTFTTAPRFSSTTASEYLAVDSSKDLISKSLSTMKSDLGITTAGIDEGIIAVSISGGALGLDLDSKRERAFDITTTVSSNFNFSTLSNASNFKKLRLTLRITGTITITFPSTAYKMDLFEVSNGRWNNATQVLTLTGTTASPFMLELVSDGTNIIVFATNRLV